MYAAVVKFDTLTDTVGTSAKDHDLLLVGSDGVIIRCIVGRIEVGTVFGAADMYVVPCLDNTQCFSFISDIIFGYAEDL